MEEQQLPQLTCERLLLNPLMTDPPGGPPPGPAPAHLGSVGPPAGAGGDTWSPLTAADLGLSQGRWFDSAEASLSRILKASATVETTASS